jgi:hypothetical protein
MNTKQKSIITIYVIVAILSLCFAIYFYFSIAADGWVIINGHEVALNTIPNGYANAFLGDILFCIIGLIILGIPTYVLYRVWGDKK